MTDEKRARAILGGHFGDADHGLMQNILKHFAAIRADERENCAQVAEAVAGDQGEGAINYHRLGAMDAAVAIRARGSS